MKTSFSVKKEVIQINSFVKKLGTLQSQHGKAWVLPRDLTLVGRDAPNLLSPHLMASKVGLLGRNYPDLSFLILGWKSEEAPWSRITRVVSVRFNKFSPLQRFKKLNRFIAPCFVVRNGAVKQIERKFYHPKEYNFQCSFSHSFLSVLKQLFNYL